MISYRINIEEFLSEFWFIFFEKTTAELAKKYSWNGDGTLEILEKSVEEFLGEFIKASLDSLMQKFLEKILEFVGELLDVSGEEIQEKFWERYPEEALEDFLRLLM